MIRTLRRSSPSLFAICFVLAGTASLLAQGLDRGVVVAPVGKAGERLPLYSGSYALLVGVSQYDVRDAWSPLESVPRELDEVEGALKESGFSVVTRVRNPTGDQLRTAVADFIQEYGHRPNARLVFFLAGHGYTLDNGDRGFFVPKDAPNPRIDDPGFRRIALEMLEVNTWARNLTAKHALFVFDSCFSGSIFRTRSSPVAEAISPTTDRPVRQFLAAGSAFETVPATSVFAPVFIRGLKGAADSNRDGYVTGSELGVYVAYHVANYGSGQTPQFGRVQDPRLDQGELVFAVLPGFGPAPVDPRSAPPATRGGPPPSASASGTSPPIAIAFESFTAFGTGGTRSGGQGTLTIAPGRIEFREINPAAGGIPNTFAAPCTQIAYRSETEDDGRVHLRIELKSETFKLYSASNARRALGLVYEACKQR